MEVQMEKGSECAILVDDAGTLPRSQSESLALRLAASQLFDLLLLLPARSSPLGLGSGLFTGGAFQFLAFQLVFNFGGVCHV